MDALTAELLEAAKQVFESTTECRHGHWLVPNAAVRRLVVATEALDPTWRPASEEA